MKRHSPPQAHRGPEHYWAAMCELTRLNGRFALAEVHGLTNGVSLRTVKEYLRFCLGVGAIAIAEVGTSAKGRPRHLYRVEDLSVMAPIQRRASFAADRGRRAQQLWTAMRALRVFGAAELAFAASTDDLTVSVRRAREYIRALADHGYLVETRERLRTAEVAQWRLMPSHNTGPLCPAITAQGLVDRNLAKSVNPNRLRRAA